MKLYLVVMGASILIAAHVMFFEPKKPKQKQTEMHELVPGKVIFIPVHK